MGWLGTAKSALLRPISAKLSGICSFYEYYTRKAGEGQGFFSPSSKTLRFGQRRRDYMPDEPIIPLQVHYQ